VSVSRRAGALHLARREFEHAARAFQAALLEDPDDLDAREGLGLALARSGACAEAIRELDRVLAKDAARPLALRARSEALMRLGRFDAALDPMRRAMRLQDGEGPP
jgi:Flp pilus assembly protein TadD